MKGRAYREAGMFMVRHMPLEERTSRWPWLLDQRIRVKYFTQKEGEKLLRDSLSLYEKKVSGRLSAT
ncbi:MAG TPA: hypothetical protein VLH40_01570 [Atribacteraceae bacterium]|nr:hypothetical protein [Atribacteraceae bacterium]